MLKAYIHNKKKYIVLVDTRRGEPVIDKRGFIHMVSDKEFDKVNSKFFDYNFSIYNKEHSIDKIKKDINISNSKFKKDNLKSKRNTYAEQYSK